MVTLINTFLSRTITTTCVQMFLGVARNHALTAAAGDLCWMPTHRHQQQLILLWLSLTKMDGNRMCRKIYETARTYAESNGIENWAFRVKTILHIYMWLVPVVGEQQLRQPEQKGM